MTEPDATWVVDSANPRCVDARIVAAVDVSAAKPCAGFTSVRPVPRVLMMRQPPMYVPSAIAMAHVTITHPCTSSPELCMPAATSVSVMTPIVFWASFVPCASATSDDEKTCAYRNPSRPSGLPS
jgi:hypothetical protein